LAALSSLGASAFSCSPRDKGILATALHYNYEVRDEHAYFDDIPDITIPAEMLDLAKHIIQTKMSHFDITKFEDRYENALIEMIRAKQAGRPVEAARPQQPTTVVNLMEALRKSIAAETGEAGVQEAEGGAGGGRPRRARKTTKAPANEGRRLLNAAEARVEPRRTGRAKGDDVDRPSPSAGAKPARKTAGPR